MRAAVSMNRCGDMSNESTEKAIAARRSFGGSPEADAGKGGGLACLGRFISEEEDDPPFSENGWTISGLPGRGGHISEAVGKVPERNSPRRCGTREDGEKTGAWDDILQEIADGLQEGTFN